MTTKKKRTSKTTSGTTDGTIPTSIRLDQDQKQFILAWSKADDISKALRKAIQDIQDRSLPPSNVEDAQARLLSLLHTVSTRTAQGERSVVLEDLVREASLVFATALAGPPRPGIDDPAARQSYEAAVIDRSFDFVEALLRHALATESSAWDPMVVHNRLKASRKVITGALATSSKLFPPAALPTQGDTP